MHDHHIPRPREARAVPKARAPRRARRGLRGLAALGVVALAATPAFFAGSGSAAAPVGQGFTVTPSDLSHILRQIKIAEHHVSATTPAFLAGPDGDAGTPDDRGICDALVGPAANQVPSPLIADGLRTVDGSCNNLVHGQEKFGAEGELFPRLTQPLFRDAEESLPMFGPPHPTSYKGAGSVFDSRPRTISNLIVDQTSSNPAAISAAGFPVRAQGGNAVTACVNEVQTISGTPTGDFTITVGATSVGPIPAGADAAAVFAAFSAAGIPVEVDGGPLPDEPFRITFTAEPTENVAQATVDAGLTAATEREGVAADTGACVPAHRTLFIENVTTDVGLSPPFNSLFTIFGQFFDHGVDKTNKPGATVFIPLKADDPLVAGKDHVFGTADDLDPSLRFMTLSRAAKDPDGPDNIPGNADDQKDAINTDTPFVDQSQTYTSHPAHQVFLRAYELVGGKPVNNGKLINGSAAGGSGVEGGQANWSEVKEQAAAKLGLALRDKDVLDIPLVAADAYGNFIPGPNGLPQWVTETGLVEGVIGAPVAPPANVKHFSTAFLDDIAHSAVPNQCSVDDDGDPATPPVKQDKQPDANDTAGGSLDPVAACEYDNELLDLHFMAGDGRVNENIALTSVHQIFHSEHNRLVDDIETTLAKPENEALRDAYHATGPDTFAYGERIFQAARFVTEMEYQHLVFEEFARKVQPLINPFAGFAFTQANINPAVKAEFAHAVYRFGHSMLTENINRIAADGTHYDIPLLDGFLNPAEYGRGPGGIALDAEVAGGNILMGLSDDPGNEIDEFVTDTLRNNLLGLPLDLPSINMTRARSEGIPPLNQLRRQIYASTNDSAVQPYKNWIDFGQGLKHPESLVNFVAAYGTHPTITGATTLKKKRAAARAIVDPQVGDVAPGDAFAFLNGTDAWVDAGGVTTTGLDDVDLWVGGLAERTNLFGGLLGATFNYVFEAQLTDLQNSDRLYYLGRTPGMNLRAQLEGNSFAELVMRNTNAHTLKADAFATADCKFELGSDPGIAAPINGNLVTDDLYSECNEAHLLIRMADGTIQYRERNADDPPGINGQSVYNGTAGTDRIHGGVDNDTFLGNEGVDIIEGGDGADVALGGDGNDRITDIAGDDVLKGGPGNDAMEGGPGLDILMGGEGKDFMNGGANINEIFAGEGDDFMILGQGEDAAQGDSGDDWMEGGDQPDLLQGDSGTLFFTDRNRPGHDVTIGQAGDDDYDVEGGDDIMIADPGIEKSAGAAGFDWYIGARDPLPQNADLRRLILPEDQREVETRDRFNEVEALSGGKLDDRLWGDDVAPADVTGGGFIGCDALDQAGLDRISGLDEIVPDLTVPSAPIVAGTTTHDCLLQGNVWGAGNILLGGAGSDVIEGRGADDIIDGDRYLDVRLSVRNGAGTEIGSADLMEHPYLEGSTRTLQDAVMDGTVDPGNIVIVREILTPAGDTGTDTAVFSEDLDNYDVTENEDGSVTVAHVRGTATDGTDTLRNIEVLRFAGIDSTLESVLAGAPVPPAPPGPPAPVAPQSLPEPPAPPAPPVPDLLGLTPPPGGATDPTPPAPPAPRVAPPASSGPLTLGLVRVATANSIRTVTITKTGIPVSVKVPARVKVLRFRIMNGKRKVLFTSFQTVKAGKQLKLSLRSAALRGKLLPGKRYVLEVTPGTSRTALGKPSLTSFTVRR